MFPSQPQEESPVSNYYETAVYIVASAKGPRHPRMVCTNFTSGSRCHGCLESLVRVCTCGGEGPKPTPGNPASHHYFKYCKISALALLKMVMHARSGGNLEVMGLMLGKVDGETMIIMDSFALPVEGTETRVNAQAAAYEYMAAYIENAKQVGRLENAIGWYHSHPGYGCWLSGIDVSTQMLNQQFQEPFVAVVIDPTRTISAGKVNLGAFRTYPKGYKPPDEGPSEYQTIPLNKIEDFGVHCKQYYALEVSYFKSSLDRKLLELLWNKYWVNTLSSSSLLTNADYTTGQVFDLSEKLEQSEAQLGRGSFMLGLETHDRKSEDKLAKATRDSCKTTIEAIHGLMSQVIKDKLFNQINIS
ncbi:COP9 signalosome complex subunit 5 isoform X1 [Equus quagga]|uniref:COP9 signalosome complex subunit 5 isoform X1 n=1 Tax=Equus quagga TaxID=89248 RepID=UPI001EE18A68|nr:COP9 signalosome complex subunit 5 isoform X1 [Equus quagga]